jgi:hypothetical protein
LRPDHGVAATDIARKLKFFGSQFGSHRETWTVKGEKWRGVRVPRR